MNVSRIGQVICQAEGCQTERTQGPYCVKHYTRMRKHGDLNRGRLSREDRFWLRVAKGDTCWEWKGIKDRDGYGRFHSHKTNNNTGTVTVRAHRFAYELLVGPIADGLQIDHLCKNRRCVNPDHLEPVTQLENIRRGQTGKLNSYHRQKTHCPHRHEYGGCNLVINPTSGGRVCRICKNAHARASYLSQRRKVRDR